MDLPIELWEKIMLSMNSGACCERLYNTFPKKIRNELMDSYMDHRKLINIRILCAVKNTMALFIENGIYIKFFQDDFIENDPEGDGPSPLEETIGEEEKEVLRGAVKRLPPKSQKVFELVYFQGKKYREAAEELGIPDGTVKSVMSRAKEELREDVELKNYRRDAA